MVFLKLNCEIDIWMSGVEILQKLSSGGYIVEQRKSVIHISKPDGGTRINISNPFLFKVTHFEIIATGKSDLQCKIKETLLISELKPSLNENVGSEKLFLY